MADFMHRDFMENLFDKIVNKHWKYLETEESLDKIEKRKKLEDCIRQYLYTVQHDRKYSLRETAHVVKNSIRDLENFSAQEAITAFESISQYANNLFTKPWRKEFRILKMYSGFYQHEIKSSLLDAEQLFKAMGYRRFSDDTLILDGPICPDQVSNVSRDAMIAYIELQIIKHIFTSLNDIDVNCSLLDIYRYREKWSGGPLDSIKGLIYCIEDERRSRQNTLISDNYGYVQPSPNFFETSSQFCPNQCQCNMYQQVPSVSRHYQIGRPNGTCCPLPSKINLINSNMSYPSQYNFEQNHHPGMSNDGGGAQYIISHSRSLEHYSEPTNHHNNILPHRHSFDHQQFYQSQQHYHHQQQPQHQQQIYYLNQRHKNLNESPYDCIDGNSLGGGSSTISYAAVAGSSGAVAIDGSSSGAGVNCNLNSRSTYSHPYNVSGNRFPLPLNISNQLLSYDNPQSTNCNGSQEPTYARITGQQIYSSDSKLPQNLIKNTTAAGYNPSEHVYFTQKHSSIEDTMQRQSSCQSDQLINFENPTTQQQIDPANQHCLNFETLNKNYNKRNTIENPSPSIVSTCQVRCGPEKPPSNNDMYVYAKPTPRENRNALNLRKQQYNSGECGDTTDMRYESANDEFGKRPNGNEQNQRSSPKKDQDGVGSIESWSQVFQNLEENAYTKDLGERKDLLVQSLDLDSLNINKDISASPSSSTETRRTYYSGNDIKSAAQFQQNKYQQNKKNKIYENQKNTAKDKAKVENGFSETSCTDNLQKQETLMDNNSKKMKSALKKTNSKSGTHINKPIDNKKLHHKTMNNNDILPNPGNEAKKHQKLLSTTNKSPSIVSPIVPSNPTQIIVTGKNEWDCRHCTYLNSNTKNICEMCYRSKDFNLDSSTSSTSKGRTAVAHNTPTCA